jgi:hypothetical protein
MLVLSIANAKTTFSIASLKNVPHLCIYSTCKAKFNHENQRKNFKLHIYIPKIIPYLYLKDSTYKHPHKHYAQVPKTHIYILPHLSNFEVLFLKGGDTYKNGNKPLTNVVACLVDPTNMVVERLVVPTMC